MDLIELTQEQVDFYKHEGLPTNKREQPQNFPWQQMQQTARAERAKAAQENS